MTQSSLTVLHKVARPGKGNLCSWPYPQITSANPRTSLTFHHRPAPLPSGGKLQTRWKMRGNLQWGGQQRKWTRASCLSQLHTAVTPGHGTDFLPRPVCPRDWGLSSRAARSRPPAHPSRASDDRGKGAGEEARACRGGGSSRIQALRLRVHSCFLGTDPLLASELGLPW